MKAKGKQNARAKTKTHALIGKLFRSERWQGQVVGEPNPGYYLVQHFSFLTGERTSYRLVAVSDMVEWQFFDTTDELDCENRRLRKKERNAFVTTSDKAK